MSILIPVTFCGRTFTAQEIELMRVVTQDYATLAVAEIASTVCELLEWKRPNGRLKSIECRQLLERLQAEGMLTLPAIRKTKTKGPQRVDISQQSLEPDLVECAARECEPLELALVEGTADSRLWREHMERHHYLGCRVPFGANLRYWVRNRDRELACLLWVRVKGLASKILALSARKMPLDWRTAYGHAPLLMETLVDTNRFRGTCYRAANWICLGQTAGRGRMDREHKLDGQAVKDIYVYPLVRHARQRLCADPTPETDTPEPAPPASLPESLPPVPNAASASVLEHFRSAKTSPFPPPN